MKDFKPKPRKGKYETKPLPMSISMPPELHKTLKEIAAMEDLKLSPLVVRVLQKFVEEYET